MINAIKFINKEHTLISVQPIGWVMPYASMSWHKKKVTQWEEGRTDVWDLHKAVYDNYIAIINYDTLLAEYIQCNTDAPNNPFACGKSPVKPIGYFTQEEVDLSITIHGGWLTAKLAWDLNDENQNAAYPIREPLIYKIPADLSVVEAPNELIPNVIEAYSESLADVIASKQIELQNNFFTEANADVTVEGQVWEGGIDNAKRIKNSADFAGFRGAPRNIIHDKSKRPHDFIVAKLNSISSDIWEQYNNANIKYQARLKEIDDCNIDTVCVQAITWS